jgi:hypothetical protein
MVAPSVSCWGSWLSGLFATASWLVVSPHFACPRPHVDDRPQVSLGEMVSYLPIPGGHIKLAERFVDPAFSFVRDFVIQTCDHSLIAAFRQWAGIIGTTGQSFSLLN